MDAERVLRRAGVYFFRTDVDELPTIAADPGRISDVTRELVLERVAPWVHLAEERLDGSDVQLFVSAGNDDIFEVDDLLEASPRIVHHDGKAVPLDATHTLVGLGYANITPWDCPRDLPEDELA